MTERKRVETTCNKVQKRYPDLTDKRQIVQMAVRLEQRRTLWVCVAFLYASIVCAVGWCLLGDGALQSAIRCVMPVLCIEAAFEYFRNTFNAVKIRAHFGCGGQEAYQGMLTYDQIRRDIRKAKKDREQGFRIVKASLYDKSDRDDSAVSWIFHKYHMYFQLDGRVDAVEFRVKRRVYLKAPLDAPYMLVLSQTGNVLAAYPANAWDVAGDVAGICGFHVEQHNSSVSKTVESAEHTGKKGKYTAWNIILLAANVIAYFLPVGLALLYLPVTTFFATMFTVKNKNGLSVAGMILGYVTISLMTVYLCFYLLM